MYSSVLVTVPNMVTAKKIGRSLVERRLAACVNYWTVDSTYRWKGKIVEDGEVAMLFKVAEERYKELERTVLEMHPYEVPCIVRYRIADGHMPYLDWIKESTCVE
ncbi:MAG TPA: divalent-cation tolerance protein CutA [Methanomassiliicoccales archaeon]|nr:divalent-cation tolerance protein CutA [Methanomassiliicoccales archaeon]